MAEQLSREEFYRAVDGLSIGLGRIEGRLAEQNGRLRITEQEIAVLNDRANRAQEIAEHAVKDATWVSRKWGGVGAGLAALIAGVMSYFIK